MTRRVEATDHYGGPSLTEAQLKARVLELAHAAGWMVYHRPARWQTNGGGSGYPDLTLVRHGEVLWLELKQEKGKLTDAQEAWMAALPAGLAYVIRPSNVEDRSLAYILAMRHGPLG